MLLPEPPGASKAMAVTAAAPVTVTLTSGIVMRRRRRGGVGPGRQPVRRASRSGCSSSARAVRICRRASISSIVSLLGKGLAKLDPGAVDFGLDGADGQAESRRDLGVRHLAPGEQQDGVAVLRTQRGQSLGQAGTERRGRRAV